MPSGAELLSAARMSIPDASNSGSAGIQQVGRVTSWCVARSFGSQRQRLARRQINDVPVALRHKEVDDVTVGQKRRVVTHLIVVHVIALDAHSGTGAAVKCRVAKINVLIRVTSGKWARCKDLCLERCRTHTANVRPIVRCTGIGALFDAV